VLLDRALHAIAELEAITRALRHAGSVGRSPPGRHHPTLPAPGGAASSANSRRA
jgi:hypothetical protein